MKREFVIFICILIPSAFLGSCRPNAPFPPLSSADSIRIVEDNLAHRADADAFFLNDPDSPFQRDSTVSYHGIKWFPVDPRYRAESMLHRYDKPETVIVLGTKGEERKQLRYGFFEFDVLDESGDPVTLRINIYKFTPYDAKRYALYKNNLSVWFTDKTTGTETYGVGRYVEIGDENPDPAHIYTIDLNKAYNPYCAYSDLFSCAVPRKEDHLEVALRVGEMKYHE